MASPEEVQPKSYVSSTSALAFATALLEANGLPSSSAATVATHLVSADLHGIDTHGILRLPSYLARARTGALSVSATPSITPWTPAITIVDGNNAFGHLVADAAVRWCISTATARDGPGVGVAVVRRSNHFGASSSFAKMAAKAGCVSLIFTNSSPAMAAWGGRDKVLGVSPICAGAPGKTVGEEWVLDMAPSIAARGKVYKALRRGEQIPEGWALDREGRMTRSPKDALEGGVMLPMGGPKGSALAILMDVFSGVLSGAKFAGDVVGPYETQNLEEGGVGHFFLVMRADVFLPLGEFRARMQTLYDKVTGSTRMQGVDRVWFPGEMEMLEARRREKEGIPYASAEIEALDKEADRVGVRHIEIMERSSKARL